MQIKFIHSFKHTIIIHCAWTIDYEHIDRAISICYVETQTKFQFFSHWKREVDVHLILFRKTPQRPMPYLHMHLFIAAAKSSITVNITKIWSTSSVLSLSSHTKRQEEPQRGPHVCYSSQMVGANRLSSQHYVDVRTYRPTDSPWFLCVVCEVHSCDVLNKQGTNERGGNDYGETKLTKPSLADNNNFYCCFFLHSYIHSVMVVDFWHCPNPNLNHTRWNCWILIHIKEPREHAC